MDDDATILSGITRRIDDLGRIVLPVELRRRFALRPGDALSVALTASGDGVVLRPLDHRCVFCGATDDLAPHRGKQVCGPCAAEVGRRDGRGGAGP